MLVPFFQNETAINHFSNMNSIQEQEKDSHKSILLRYANITAETCSAMLLK
jgi:hypothetical protein